MQPPALLMTSRKQVSLKSRKTDGVVLDDHPAFREHKGKDQKGYPSIKMMDAPLKKCEDTLKQVITFLSHTMVSQ